MWLTGNAFLLNALFCSQICVRIYNLAESCGESFLVIQLVRGKARFYQHFQMFFALFYKLALLLS